MRILKKFKSSVFGSADSKRVTRLLCGSADSTGFTVGMAFDGWKSETPRYVRSVRITISDNTKKDSMLVTSCQGPIWDESIRMNDTVRLVDLDKCGQ